MMIVFYTFLSICISVLFYGYYNSPLKSLSIKIYPFGLLFGLLVFYYFLKGCFFNIKKCYDIKKNEYEDLIALTFLFINCTLFLFLNTKSSNKNITLLFAILVLSEIAFFYYINQTENEESYKLGSISVGKKTLKNVSIVFIIQLFSFYLDVINKKKEN